MQPAKDKEAPTAPTSTESVQQEVPASKLSGQEGAASSVKEARPIEMEKAKEEAVPVTPLHSDAGQGWQTIQRTSGKGKGPLLTRFKSQPKQAISPLVYSNAYLALIEEGVEDDDADPSEVKDGYKVT